MEIIKMVETFGASLLICLILLKQMEKKEENLKEEREAERLMQKEEREAERQRQFDREQKRDNAQYELLDTNRTLADTVKEITQDMRKDLDITKDTVIRIAEKMEIK